MALKVKLEEIFNGHIVECLICSSIAKAKHLGLELVAPKVMVDDDWAEVVICRDCLRKEKGTIKLDWSQKAEALEKEAQRMRLIAAQEVDLPSYEELEKRELRINLEVYCDWLKEEKKVSQAHVHWDNGIPKIKVKTLDGIWRTLRKEEVEVLFPTSENVSIEQH